MGGGDSTVGATLITGPGDSRLAVVCGPATAPAVTEPFAALAHPSQPSGTFKSIETLFCDAEHHAALRSAMQLASQSWPADLLKLAHQSL